MKQVPIDQIKASKTNPRKNFSEDSMKELTESVKAHGVLQPILIRKNGHGFEIVAGDRRFRAATAAGLKEIPAIEKDLTDAEVLEIHVIENMQRVDLHPIEEAEGYSQLLQLPKPHKYDAAKIAARVGRSVKYVYDRIKLLNLIEPLRKDFINDKITAGHAILLARLKSTDQTNARQNGLYESEAGLYSDGEKARSVRELEGWIDEHCRFDVKKDVDPMLFPETAVTLKAATEKAEKVVPITHAAYIQDDARTTEHVVGPRSWTRADGKNGSKTCEYSAVGVFVVGENRGESMRVCTNKDKCRIHWGELIKGRAKREKERANAEKSGKPVIDTRAIEEQHRKNEEAKEQAARARWKKGLPQILEALAGAVKKAPTKSTGLLSSIVLENCRPDWGSRVSDPTKYVPIGTTAEDVVRHGAFLILSREAMNEYHAPKEFPKRLRAFGLDAKKILDEAVPILNQKNEAEEEKKETKKYKIKK